MRIRTVKPEWLDDVLLNTSSSDARVLSIAFILFSDDYGNGRCEKIQVGLRVFPPADESPDALATSSRRFREALARLEKIRFVGLYTVNDQTYFTIRNWKLHQNVDHPGKPLVPGPPADFWTPSRDPRENLETRAPAESTNQKDPQKDQPRDPRAHAHAHTPAQAPAREAVQQPSQTPTDKPSLSSAARCEKLSTQANATTVTLFEAWKRESGKSGARMDWSRRVLFDRLVSEGVTVEEVVCVTRGALQDEWATKKARMDPHAILGTVGQREKFSDIEKSDRVERSNRRYPVVKNEPEHYDPPTAEQLESAAEALGIRSSHSRLKVSRASGALAPVAESFGARVEGAPLSPSAALSAPVKDAGVLSAATLDERRAKSREALKQFDESAPEGSTLALEA